MSRALGRYELLRPLARGGMAEVYLARRRAAGVEKWLVVKRMRPERSGDPRFLELFVREARLSMSLVHQNIVPVFDFGRIDEQVFLAMERVEGRDLGSSLARAGTHRVPPLLAAFIAAECCQALEYAHERKGPDGVALGIVHRDVTPRNVLLSWSGEVKLTDFGIAALAGEATSRLLGTPQYMAPEQARGEAIDRRADVYAIGLVLREAVAGARPRPGGDRDAILGAARAGTLLPWAHVDGSADDAPPAGLVAIIDRATAAAPADRYPDAHSMFEDLDSFIVSQRAAHKAESPARQLAIWLAAVWEGARDEVEGDAAIDADHLVSFLDDGPLELIGTGTIRSLAATAADDALLVPAPPPAPVAPPPAANGNAATESSKKLTRVSSSVSTVASGSFHTLAQPTTDRDLPSGVRTTQPPARRPWRFAALVLTTAAATSAAVFVTNAIRNPDEDAAPVALAPRAQPTAASPGPPPTAASPDPPPTAASPDPPPTAASPNAAPLNAAPPNAASANPARPNTAPPPPRPPADRPSAGQSTPRPPVRPSNPTRDAGGQPPAATTTDAPKPALCRVRINLTPWAYYTADGDPTRHETPGTIDLAPGPHRLHVWNPELRIERDITINVPADRETMNYSEPLQPPTLAPDSRPRH